LSLKDIAVPPNLQNSKHQGVISGSDGGKYKDGCLMVPCAVLTGRSLPTFQLY
jgi:hypothetical protein